MKNCIFCGNDRSKSIMDMGFPNPVVLETEHFYITPDFSPLFVGHLLVVTKEHLGSMAELDYACYEELNELKRVVLPKLLASDNLIFFEHGSVKKIYSAATIEHAHLHAIPFVEGFNDEYVYNYLAENESKIGNVEECNTYEVLHSYYENIIPYLYIEWSNKGIIASVNENITSQILRKMFQPFSHECYDWKKTINSESNIERFKRTLELVNRNKEDLK